METKKNSNIFLWDGGNIISIIDIWLDIIERWCVKWEIWDISVVATWILLRKVAKTEKSQVVVWPKKDEYDCLAFTYKLKLFWKRKKKWKNQVFAAILRNKSYILFLYLLFPVLGSLMMMMIFWVGWVGFPDQLF